MYHLEIVFFIERIFSEHVNAHHLCSIFGEFGFGEKSIV